MNEKKIVTVNDYGRIELNLRDIMDSRGISRNQLARSINTRFEVVDKWYKGDVEKLDLDILARICWVLDCSADEIIKHKNG